METVVKHQMILAANKKTKEGNYWLSQLFSSGDLVKSCFPPDQPGHKKERQIKHVNFHFPSSCSGPLMEICKGSDLKMFIILTSVLTALLHRYTHTGNDDIIIGTPIFRQHGEKDFINTVLPLRNPVERDMTFRQLLMQIKQNLEQALENRNYPVELLAEHLEPSYSQGDDFPLFDVTISVENIQDKKFLHSIQTNILFSFRRIDPAIEGMVEYNAVLYRENYIQQIIRHLERLLQQVLENMELKLSQIDILSPQEKVQILVDFNDTKTGYPRNKTIPQLFWEQVEQTPDHICISVADSHGFTRNNVLITYKILNEKSNQLARILKEKGVEPDSIVGIMTERSVELIIGLLGILKAGGAYLPIDPQLPGERINYMLEDSRARILVRMVSKVSVVSSVCKVIDINDISKDAEYPPIQPLTHSPTPLNLAYSIYTSGTTGKPKGVLILHQGVVNMIWCHREVFRENSQSRISQTASISFDAMALEVWPCLSAGAVLCIIDEKTRIAPWQLKEWLIKHQITISFQPTIMAQQLLEERWPETGTALEALRTGGDKLTSYPTRSYSFRFYNLYGPTEDTIWTTWTEVPMKSAVMTDNPSIGKPVANKQVYILNQDLKLQPIGVPGELCIAGEGLAVGYQNRPELTAEKFKRAVISQSLLVIRETKRPLIPNDQCPMTNDRLYKTGDLARWLHDGNIEFLGRIDQQVKIRGFRIELGEIENQLLEHEEIKKAIVIINEDKQGAKYLCAYVVPDSPHCSCSSNTLREYLSSHLPDYMIPSYIMQIEKIPLTTNGKIDRKALPPPEITPGSDYVAPRSAVEKKLAQLWSEVLNLDIEFIGIDDNFFERGGHSLKATVLVSKIHKALNIHIPLTEIFRTPMIRELAEYIKEVKKDKYSAIESIEKMEYYALSSAQQRLFILQQMELQNIAYNITEVISLTREPDLEKLEKTFIQLIQRHGSLRTSFHMKGDVPVQKVHDTVEFKLEYNEKTVIGQDPPPHSQHSPYSTQDIIRHFEKPFDLSTAPLLKVGVVKTDESTFILVVVMHHIVSDGISHEILIKDFMALDEGKKLPPLRIQYKDFSQWQNSEKEKEKIKRQATYWHKEFGIQGEIPILNIPTDYPRPIIQSFEGSTLSFEIGKIETQLLKTNARLEGVTLFMLFLAVNNIWLARISNQEDIVIGTPIAGRRHTDLESVIGMFVNTLALRNYPGSEKTFKDFLIEVKEKTLEAFENQEYQFEDLVEKLAPNRDTSRNPLFDVMYTFQILDRTTGNISKEKSPGKKEPGKEKTDVRKQENGNTNSPSKFDLTVNGAEVGQELSFTIEYCTKLFKKETIQRFVTYFKKIVSTIAKEPGIPLWQIDILSEKEKNQLLYDFNDTAREYPKNKRIHQLFEEQANRSPNNTAVIFRDRKLTYKELNHKSSQLAEVLRKKGVLVGTIVAMMMERSIEMIIAILGILKAGGAYLPIDPDYPEDRINYMLADSSTKVLITTSTLAEEIKKLRSWEGEKILMGGKLINAESSGVCPNLQLKTRTSLAYIIYTSGSTGNPRGVMVEHRNVVGYVNTFLREFQLTSKDTVIQQASISFDAFIEEVFPILSRGGKIALPEKYEIIDMDLFSNFILNQNVTLISCTPLLLNELNKLPNTQGITTFISGGDELKKGHVDELVKRGTVYNTYGPTETTVCVTYHKCLSLSTTSIPIGKPISNYNVYIRDRNKKLVPPGIPGEICVAGIGVTRGYLNQPELTGEKFKKYKIQNTNHKQITKKEETTSPHYPITPSTQSHIYFTGDLGKWLPDGNILFLGRIDHQVKIRGFRIEPGEIESHLLKNGKINDAVVVARDDNDGNKYLCAYIVAQRQPHGAWRKELREFLSKTLPDYMIPAYFMPIERIPLTPNGKIHRKALPKPEPEVGQGYIAPRDLVEERLVELWSGVLAIEKHLIGIDSNFFELGGHSLKATILIARIHRELDVKLPLTEVFKTPRIRELSTYIKNQGKDKYSAIEPIEKKEYYALSSAQKRLYILQQVELESTAYNISQVITLTEKLDLEIFEKIFTRLIQRHESLRTSFHMVGDEPVQEVHDTVEFKIEYYEKTVSGQWSLVIGQEDPSHSTHSPYSTYSTRDIKRHFNSAFDLSQAPLLKVGIVKTDAGQYVLVVVMHHIISDGISLEILVKDFIALDEGKELPLLRILYKDFSQWQNKEKQKEELKHQELYWLKEFEGEIPVLNIPTDYPRPIIQSFEGNTVSFELERIETQLLKTNAREEGVTLFMLWLTITNIWLAKISNQEDIVIGTPIAGRRHADLEKIIGMFVNTLVLRNYPGGEKNFKNFLNEVKQRTLEAFENQEYQFEDLVEKVAVHRDASRNPLFDVMYTFENPDRSPNDKSKEKPPGNQELETEKSDMRQPDDEDRYGTAKFDLTLNSIEENEKILFTLHYSTKLFNKKTIQRFVTYFKKVVSTIAKEPVIPLWKIEILSEKEKKQLLDDFNDTARKYPKNKTLQQLFEEQVDRYPDNAAVIFHDGKLTYKELNHKSNQLAEVLSEKGVLADTIVGMMMERSIEMIISILGILKAGSAYLPIDPDYPEDRINYMLSDSHAKILLTMKNIAKAIDFDKEMIYLNSASPQAFKTHPKGSPSFGIWNLEFGISPRQGGQLAYIIYTSGSTGKPRGVMVEHLSVINLAFCQKRRFQITVRDRILQFSSISFDASVEQIFISFYSGAGLVLVDKDTLLDKKKFEEFLFNHLITHIHAVPSFLKTINVPGYYHLKRMIAGGDICSPALAQEWHNICDFYNEYGPTETTVTSIEYLVKKPDNWYAQLPIGKALDNTEVYILDRWGNPLPCRTVGELYIGGDGVARGYLNNPELTADKFRRMVISHSSLVISSSLKTNVQCPMTNDRSPQYPITPLPHSPIYHTGDMARWLSDGNIEFLGRSDHQVKIRGFRIEPGEIESHLLKHKEIKDAVVVAKDDNDGNKYLCAYIVAQHEAHGTWPKELKEFLSKTLPDYMIPAYFIPIEKIPLTPSGKTDRRNLPAPVIQSPGSFAAPRDEIEEKLAKIWTDVLKTPISIGIDDNFFDLGGHSLKGLILISKIHKELNVKVPLAELFKTPVVRGLAEYIKQAEKEIFSAIEPVEKKEYYTLASAQKRLYILQHIDLSSTVYNIPEVVTLPEEPDLNKFEETFIQLIKRHESLRTSFHMADDQPVQKVHQRVPFDIEHVEARKGIENEIIHHFDSPFDLSRAPLLKAGIIKQFNGNYLLVVVLHHIISDGASHEILVKDFMAFYQENQLPPLRIQYKDFAQWQDNEQQKNQLMHQKAYWLKEFGSEIPLLNLPTDYPRPQVQSFAGNNVHFEISASETEALKRLSLASGATLFMVILGIYNVFLAKLSNQEEISIGSPIAGRRHESLEKIIGMFVNTLTLRNYPVGEKPFIEFLQEVKQRALEAYENQDYQFEELVDNIGLKRDLSRNPLFDVMFVLQNLSAGNGDIIEPMEEESIKPYNYDYKHRTAKFDLTLAVVEKRERLSLSFEYCTALFKKETVQRFILYFNHLISEILENKNKSLKDMEMIPAAEKRTLLEVFNDTGPSYPGEKSIPGLFAEQVTRTPGNVAVVTYEAGCRAITYRELDEKSNQLARYLNRQGVRANDFVGLLVNRSFEMFIAVLGILKAGCAYVPLDLKAPEARRQYILEECDVKLLLTDAELVQENYSRISGLKPGLEIEISPGDFAYTIFTSGSTGTPKGVPITHSNLSPLLHWGYRHLGINPTDRTLQNLSYYFDWSVWEIFITLTTGASLYAAPDEILLNPEQSIAFMQEHDITVLHATPTQYGYIANVGEGKLRTLKYLFIGAEKLTANLLERSFRTISNNCRVFNMYGPTECTIIASVQEIDRSTDIHQRYGNLSGIPIGVPVGNTSLLVLDKYYRLSPMNVVGELYIGGDGVAGGYLNNPEFTADKFDHDLWHYQDYQDKRKKRKKAPGKNYLPMQPCSHAAMQSCNHVSMQHHSLSPHYPITPLPHYPIYMTGDLARWLVDGAIEFIGRIDHQVKIRGFRIELGEIENRLLSHPAIKQAVVLASSPGTSVSLNQEDQYLYAYIVPAEVSGDAGAADAAKSDKDLKRYLSQFLPDYMVPSYIMEIEKIPLNPNGKINRKALPTPEIKTNENTVTPGNIVEKKLAKLWSDILGIDYNLIGIDGSFFELGGHSLKATIMVSRIHKELNIHVPLVEIFQRSTIRKLAEYISGTAEEKYESIRPVEVKEYYELSSAQKRLYFIQQMELDSTAYNMPEIIPLTSQPDREKLEKTFIQLIQRHESLRTSFHMVEDMPVQKVHDTVEFEIEYYETGKRQKAKGNKEELMPESLIKNFIRPFDLAKAPLLRVGLIVPLHTPAALRSHPRRGTYNSQEGKGDRFLLMVDMHHIISDGMSHEVLVKDFVVLNENKELPPPLRIQYKDFSQWQNSREKKEKIKQQEAYWLNVFAGEIPVLNIPMDYPRPAIQSFEGSALHFEIESPETQLLKTNAREEGVTLYMMLLAVFTILLSKLGGQEDIVIGTPVAGRRHADLEKIIGMFVNTLALRNYPIGTKTFSDFLKELKERTLQAFENQEYQFEDLVEKVAVNRDLARNPLFDVIFVLQNINRFPGNGVEDVTVENETIDKALPYSEKYDNIFSISKFDLTITALELEPGLKISFQYCMKLFKKETVQRFMLYFNNIVSKLLKEPGIKISEIEIIPEEERKRILYDFNDTQAEYPKDKTIHHLFEEQVECSPDRTAVIYSSIHITYRTLNEESNRLASVLQEKGVELGGIVGIMVNHSIEMIVGLLGILKAGGAYMPIDPDYPGNRKQYLLSDCGADIVLTLDDLSLLPLCSSSFSLPSCHSTSLAYILYTSGSTGQPKGVMVEHRSVVRLVKNTNYMEFSPEDRILQTGALDFDASTFEIWGALLNGLQLVLVSKEIILNPQHLEQTVRNSRTTILWMTSPLFNQVVDRNIEVFAGLKRLLVGGDVLSPLHINHVRSRFPGLLICNGYGPTENTTFSTTYPVAKDYYHRIPIGKPIANSTVYILDRFGHVQPIGIPGELCVGGDGVARGYLNNPQLTAEKFDHDLWDFQDDRDKRKKMPGKDHMQSCIHASMRLSPHHSPRYPITPLPHCPIYHTGDQARWFPDDNIEFLGRIDQQVKIRGFRIELREIESRLLDHVEIEEALVSAKEEAGNDQRYLVGYIVAKRKVDLSELRQYLSLELPGFMIPSYFVQVETFPLTPNGKIDYKALPNPKIVPGSRYVAPRNVVEESLVQLWSELLLTENASIGINDNFFELGGHSLKAAVLVSKIHKALDVQVPVAEIFKTPTIRGLASFISMAEPTTTAITTVEKQEYYEVSYNQEKLWNYQRQYPESNAYNIFGKIHLYHPVHVKTIKKTLFKLITRYESFRTRFGEVNQQLVQFIEPSVSIPLEIINLSSLPEESKESQAGKIYEENARKPFDLTCAPLFRAILVKLDTGCWNFIFIMHHIISDGWSQELLMKEFLAFYNSIPAGRDMTMETLQFQYKDFAYWQRRRVNDPAAKEKVLQYWHSKQEKGFPELQLPCDFNGKPGDYSGITFRSVVPQDIKQSVQHLAETHHTTLFMILFSAFNLLLSCLTGQEDIVCRVPAAGRDLPEIQPIMGYFVNSIIVKNQVKKNEPFVHLLNRVKETILEAFQYQWYPFEQVLADLQQGYPKISVSFNMLTMRENEAETDLVHWNSSFMKDIIDVKFPLILRITVYRNGIEILWNTQKALFKHATLEKMANQYVEILKKSTAK